MVGGEGFEPSYLEPESSVLPLDDPPTAQYMIQKSYHEDKACPAGPTPGERPGGGLRPDIRGFMPGDCRIPVRRLERGGRRYADNNSSEKTGLMNVGQAPEKRRLPGKVRAIVLDFGKLIREEIRDLPVYSPGLDIDDVKRRYGVPEVIKLASNESPIGPSQLAVDAITTAMSDISLYPDGACSELRIALSRKLGVPAESLIFGNGTDEVIDFIFYAFFDPGDAAVIGDPTFSSYELSGRTMGAEIIRVPLVDYRHDVDAMLAAVNERTKAVLFCTPHNPTGCPATTGDLEKLLAGLPREVLLVWDEAYYEYVDDPAYPDSIEYLGNNPNLVVLRTFSKAYGLAGIRIGYAVADPSMVNYLEKVRPPFNVNRLAMVGAMAATEDEGHLERSREVNARGKEYLSRELSALGMYCVPTQANFLLVRYEDVTFNLTERLLEKGIIVRNGAALGYPGYVRITIGTQDQNEKVISAITGLVHQRE